MDRVTKSLLGEFVNEHNLQGLSEDKQFEHFACFLAMSSHYDDMVQTDDLVTGDGNDTGIEAIGTIVNGMLITDPDEVANCLETNGHLDVTFVFVQAERSSSFSASKIGTLGAGVLDFFDENPRIPRNQNVDNAASVMSAIYSNSSKFKPGNPNCYIYYVTTGTWTEDKTLESRRALVLENLTQQNLLSNVNIVPIGADGIQKLFRQSRNGIERDFAFPSRTVITELPPGVDDAYLGVIPAKTFLDLIQDEAGNIIKTVFYDNVRDFQDLNTVNSRIQETLVDENMRPSFALMNNGVTIVAKKLRTTRNNVYIEDYQIVNGCQTSNILWLNRAVLDDSVMVPLRVIATHDEEIAASITRATNSQTAVGEEQLIALSDFQKRLEAYFESFDVPRRLYYERRSRQYNGAIIEKTRVVSPSTLIRSYAAMWLNEPHRTTRNYRAVRERIGKTLFASGHKLMPYYAAASANYRLEFLFRNGALDAKYKPARYHLLAYRLLIAPGAVPRPNANEMDRFCAALVESLWDQNAASRAFHSASEVIDRVANGNFGRDHIRTQPFTELVIQECQQLGAAAP